MRDLRQQLGRLMRGRVCLVGVGNPDLGDDGFGVRLAEMLALDAEPKPAAEASAMLSVLVAGATPERHMGRLMDGAFDQVVYLDAVNFGGAPGAVVLLPAEEMAARFATFSTHKISLGLLAQLIQNRSRAKAWLLGAQPSSLRGGTGLSPAVQATAELVRELIAELREALCPC